MKKISFLILIFSVASCGKNSKNIVDTSSDTYVDPKYDTTAVDSFSAGATSVDILRNIKMSSKAYQDSVAAALKQQEEERKLKEELAKEEKKKEEQEEKAQKETGNDNKPEPVKETEPVQTSPQ